MEFSQYVTEAIASIDHVEKDRDYDAISLIKGAMENANNEADAHILHIISGSMTMTYNLKEQTFMPCFIDFNGQRTFALEDIEKSDIDILCNIVETTNSLYLRTKFAHIIWLLTNNYKYAQLAATGYLELFKKSFDSIHWIACYQNVNIAYHLASLAGKSSDIFKQTKLTIKEQLIALNGADSSFLSIQLLRLLLDDLRKDELPQFVVIAETLFRKNTDPDCDNSHLSDETFGVLKTIYEKLKRNDDIKSIKEQYADYYVALARKQAEKKDYFRAVSFMKKACKIYSNENREKAVALRLEMEEWQKLSLKNLQPITVEFNVEDISKAVEERFDGLTLPEAIVQFGRTVRIYKVDTIKQQLSQKEDEQLINSMFSSTVLNENGQSIQNLPPINDTDENSDNYRKHMIRYVAEHRRMFDSIPLRMAYQKLERFGTISEDDLNFLTQNNAIIPENREEIIREGLCLGLNGKMYTAMHILLPQTENIFRNLVKLCGDTVTFLNDDGTESFKPLSSLFKSVKLLDCYDKDLIFNFQSIMDDPSGENLRNLNAHGLLEPNLGNGVRSLSFLGMLIMLLSLYKPEVLEIRRKLIELEDNITE